MRVTLYCCVVGLVLASAPVQALESFVPYDDFSAADRKISPLKWTGLEFVGHGTEASRSINAGALRMVYRAFGKATSGGLTSSGFGLLLTKKTAVIKSLQAQVKVSTAQATDCPSNAAVTSSRAGLRGSFFNTGSSMFGGGATNDVHALLFLRRVPADLGTHLRVRAQVFRCANQLCSQVNPLQEKDLGDAATGQFYTLQIEWDKPNKKFLFQIDGILPKAFIAYSLSDSAPPSVALKALELGDDVENCTTLQSQGFMDAVFDNVKVNQTAAP
jgi:hypothetical protein